MNYKKFLGATSAALLITIAILLFASAASAAGKYKTLDRIQGAKFGQQLYVSGLVVDQAGNLYGTTYNGAAYPNGVVFKLSPNVDGTWTESPIHIFCSLTKCSDGTIPFAGLILDQAGNLYGTTEEGGLCSANFGKGCGVVFKLSPSANGSWTESVLYSFCPLTNCGDGNEPVGNLVFDQAGNLYGTTRLGGVNNRGTVFQLIPNSDGTWSEKVLHEFTGGVDGYEPNGGLVFDKAGSLYGTTSSSQLRRSSGAVFKLTPNSDGSWTEKVVHSFCTPANCADGSSPRAGVVFDQAGSLYGTTWTGGAYDYGVVFRLIPKASGGWREQVLHQFTSAKDGGDPEAGVTLDASGNVYGTTNKGGNVVARDCIGTGCGVVFKLTQNLNGTWRETLLHTFSGRPGAHPAASLVFDAAGNLYGTTTASDLVTIFGSVFEITP